MDNQFEGIIKSVLKKMHLTISDSVTVMLVQFVKFGIVGMSNTVISYAINVLILLLLAPFECSWDYVAGNLVSFVLSVLWSFYWNNKYVFKSEQGTKKIIWKTLLKTYISYGITGILLNNILSYIWIEFFDISKFIAPMFNLVISVPINFLMNKFWAYNSK